MANIACFSRNRCTTVEIVDEQTTRSTCRVQDTVMEAWVEVLVKAPNLDIVEATGEIRRSGQGNHIDMSGDLQKVIGARVGPGIKKIIRGLIGDRPFVETLSALLDECCNGVIMSYTRDVLLSAPNDPLEDSRETNSQASIGKATISFLSTECWKMTFTASKLTWILACPVWRSGPFRDGGIGWKTPNAPGLFLFFRKRWASG